jgi:ketosteroid isomerase-like protein
MGMTGVVGNVSVAGAVVEAFAARDAKRLLSLFAPDVEFETRVDVIGVSHFSGHEAVRAWLDAVDEKYERYEIVDAEYRAGAGDAVFVSCHLRLQFAGDKYGMARQLYWVFRIDESGCVSRFMSFRDRDEALADAGIGP